MAETHPLAAAYLQALDELPDAWRVRRPLEHELASALTSGSHVCLRGFWRIGKTCALKGALAEACSRTSGAGFFIDLRDPDRDDGLPQSRDAVMARLAARVRAFLERVGAAAVVVDPAHPLLALGELEAPLFIGLDELIALQALGNEVMVSMLKSLLETPKNVKLIMVAHRHRSVDALFEREVVAHPKVKTWFVPPIDSTELEQIVQGPARQFGVSFDDAALLALSTITGDKPWEVFTFCHLATLGLEPGFKGVVDASRIEALMDLDTLTEHETGGRVIENLLRILTAAMSPEERALVELLAAGGEGEATEDAVVQLTQTGWLRSDDGYALRGALFEGLARAVAEGQIRVRAE